ncbi:MAG: fluoride efflux transporter CrcB [Deltaproteobacteria bacterium CG_4_10_14_0_2_um_filter_43_8]|nr:MAG: fluoride efflux transporter CrcB [Deltaproteobacteria bacterium CG11_big_fil_rev_8_21_14_0_20_42_23]PJA18533.1 MAG: fluoride efflux transporter CrcB [Deltaproteobacteria bacterium CG_4_10_14_0_2_um_filter_43_8]PJC63315.1 MAG: fluoride efflux transporter CrcB [Deltaproteobacteria bacterium CG_4_9_14_0_2_um_filter_42_21]
MFAISLGGALGAVSRHYLVLAMHHLFSSLSFPVGTLSVNVLGCFILGLAIIFFQHQTQDTFLLRSFFVIGMLGSFTTFSAFSYETFLLLKEGAHFKALWNVVSQVSISLVAIFLGMCLMEKIL